MFEFLFPIFCFGVAVTGIVVKGLITAKDMADAQMTSGKQAHPESDDDHFRSEMTETDQANVLIKL